MTSVYGGFDVPRSPVKQLQNCEYLLVTDNSDIQSDVWHVIYEPRSDVEPRLASRVAKCNPWLYTDADVTIWIDGNIEISSPYFANWCLQSLGSSSVAQFKQSSDVWAEVEASVASGKWDRSSISKMVESYLSSGYPSDYGIWWCGLMIRRKEFCLLGDQWLREVVRWTCQDQIAWSYLLHAAQVDVASLSLDFFSSISALMFKKDSDNTVLTQTPFFKIHNHAKR